MCLLKDSKRRRQDNIMMITQPSFKLVSLSFEKNINESPVLMTFSDVSSLATLITL